MYIVSNAFSLNMVNSDCTITLKMLSLNEVSGILGNYRFRSIVGHNDTAVLFSNVLGVHIPCNRETFLLKNETLIVGQYKGPRLEEGATKLPQDASIKWMQVEIL